MRSNIYKKPLQPQVLLLLTSNTKLSWSRKWLPTPVFLPGRFHGQRATVYGSQRVYMIEHAYMQQVIIQLFCFIQKFPKIIIFLTIGLKNHITFIPLGIQRSVKREKKLALEQEAHLANIIWGILKRAKLSPILSWNYTMNISLLLI